MKRHPPDELRQEHYRLRAILADHKAMSYGDLRRAHGFQPSRLEYAYQTFPEVFAAGTTPEGRPTIRLLETEAEAFDDLWLRQKLVRLVKRSGEHGTLLKTLYRSSEIESKTIKRLLTGASGIEATVRTKGQILYKWTGARKAEKEKSQTQDLLVPADQLPEPVGELNTELELVRKKLVVLCEKNHRHLSWLSNFLDPAQVHKVLVIWPDQFTVETADLGNPDLIIRNKCVVDGAAQTALPQVPQVANEPAEPLETVIPAHTLEELKWKPSSPGMGSRRNARALVRGDRIVR